MAMRAAKQDLPRLPIAEKQHGRFAVAKGAPRNRLKCLCLPLRIAVRPGSVAGDRAIDRAISQTVGRGLRFNCIRWLRVDAIASVGLDGGRILQFLWLDKSVFPRSLQIVLKRAVTGNYLMDVVITATGDLVTNAADFANYLIRHPCHLPQQ